MRMAVRQRRMGVLVGMRFVTVPVEIVRVLVVFIVYVAMRVGDRLMGMQVFMAFGQGNHTPVPIKTAASRNIHEACSPNARIAIAAPMNGAVEK